MFLSSPIAEALGLSLAKEVLSAAIAAPKCSSSAPFSSDDLHHGLESGPQKSLKRGRNESDPAWLAAQFTKVTPSGQ